MVKILYWTIYYKRILFYIFIMKSYLSNFRTGYYKFWQKRTISKRERWVRRYTYCTNPRIRQRGKCQMEDY